MLPTHASDLNQSCVILEMGGSFLAAIPGSLDPAQIDLRGTQRRSESPSYKWTALIIQVLVAPEIFFSFQSFTRA